MTTFRLPDLGEGLTESEIVAWQVAEGEEVELNQILAEVETAKASVDLPSPYAGRILKLHASPGQTIAVGAPLIEFDLAAHDGDGSNGAPAPVAAGAGTAVAASPNTPVNAQAPVATAADDDATPGEHDAVRAASDGEADDDAAPGEQDVARAASEDDDDAAPAAPQRQSVLVGYGPKVDAGTRPQRRARTFQTTPYQGRSEAEASRPTPKAMPPVRALAARLDVDLRAVRGSGPDGRILRSDVEAAAAGTAPASGPRASTFVPVSGLRKHTARAMTDSAFSAPHAAVFSTVDVTATTDLVRRGRARSEQAPSFLALAARAIMLAARRTPAANARFDAEAGQIEYHGRLNLGIAVTTERGLVVAAIADADTLDATTLTEQIATQARRAREGSLPPDELTGSTLTITNVGVFGVDGGIPILNPGESVIVALGAVSTRPWEHAGEVALRQVVNVTVSFDHRVLDGAEASAFLTDITDVLSDPAIALAR